MIVNELVMSHGRNDEMYERDKRFYYASICIESES